MPVNIQTFIMALALLTPATQAATLTPFAGAGVAGYSGDNGPALQAKLNAPFGIVRGPDGAIYFCEYNGHVIRRVAADGTISTVAGTGDAAAGGDGGPATRAALNHPHEIRFDRAGNLLIADTSNNSIRRINAKTKEITTIAGGVKSGYAGDGGPATNAQFNGPISIQLNRSDDIFVCDIGNHVIRRIDAKTGKISTIAGTGKPGLTPDGADIAGTPIHGPRSLDIDPSGNLWLATREGNQVLKLDLARNAIHHIAGTGRKGFSGDGGPAQDSTINGPKGIAIAPDGSIYLADTENHAIRRIDPKRGTIERVAGTGARGSDTNTDPLQHQLTQPHALWIDPDGTIFISDSMNHRVLVLRPK